LGHTDTRSDTRFLNIYICTFSVNMYSMMAITDAMREYESRINVRISYSQAGCARECESIQRLNASKEIVNGESVGR